MTISIIIPTLNDLALLDRTLTALSGLDGNPEIIVADGGSGDGTLEWGLGKGVRVIRSEQGRAVQMNRGAAEANGDVLLFLHADTLLPPNACAAIRTALNRREVAGGCFRLRFDHAHPVLRLSSFCCRFNFRLFHYGDSAFFVRREVFHQLQGYRPLPIMEDLDFWIRMNREGGTVVLDEEVTTSARAFLQSGVCRRQALAIRLVFLFLLGVDSRRLAGIYHSATTIMRGRTMKKTTAMHSSRPFLRPSTLRDTIADPVRAVWCWLCSNAQVVKHTFNVLDFMMVRKIGPGLLEEEHPWLNGVHPATGEMIWEKNILYASPRKTDGQEIEAEEDAQIVRRIGQFLCGMVARSNVTNPEIPQGKKRRMPHAVNYIHGTIHYNGCFIIFNDIRDAMLHLSDRRFRRELKRCGRTEKREITLVLRRKLSHPEEYAWFVSFLRSNFPWFANGNGPTKKRVLHGNPSPYPAVNTINGSWIRDMHALRKGKKERLVREPVPPGRYFTEEYGGHRTEFAFVDRFHAWMQYRYIELKGFQGGMVFTKRRKVEPENWARYLESNRQWRASYHVSHPFMRIETAREKRRLKNDGSVYPESLEGKGVTPAA